MLAVLNSHMEYMRDEWVTPPPIIEMVRLVFDGVIGCDPATCPEAQAYIQAPVSSPRPTTDYSDTGTAPLG
jgi:hypothetical protein